MQDIMLDLETTSTEPDRGAIIQIAAWKYDLRTFQVDPRFFDRCLWMPAWRSWSEDTKAFWKKQKPVNRPGFSGGRFA